MLGFQRNLRAAGPWDDAVPITAPDQSNHIYLSLKRCFDVLGAMLMAPFVIPVVALAALLVKLDGGPAFYKQERVGKGGTHFTLWKLRSMHRDAARMFEEHLRDNAEARAEWEANQKLRNDPRITRVGAFLRKYSIDELPQLLNVLRGEMSLVGPRPMLPEQRPQYGGADYFRMRPGLTGLWQVSERNGCTFSERAMHDTAYASSMSFELDLKILMRTVGVVLHGTGL